MARAAAHRTTLLVRPHRHEARFIQDAKVARDAGLVNARLLDDLALTVLPFVFAGLTIYGVRGDEDPA
jgi:hypothetical protein